VKPAAVKTKPKAKAQAKSAAVAVAPVHKDSTPTAPKTEPVSTPIETTPPPAAPVAITPPVDSASTKPAVTDSAHATNAVAKWKDGTYSAWGTSRHGDLEASVQIMNGRIVSAWISQCWTRYPCSRIATLPPQVVQRQSENVDTISGVTQSADAFYYGVMQALIKAKP